MLDNIFSLSTIRGNMLVLDGGTECPGAVEAKHVTMLAETRRSYTFWLKLRVVTVHCAIANDQTSCRLVNEATLG